MWVPVALKLEVLWGAVLDGSLAWKTAKYCGGVEASDGTSDISSLIMSDARSVMHDGFVEWISEVLVGFSRFQE